MQAPPDEREHVFVALNLTHFKRRDHAAQIQIFPGRTQTAGLAQPQQHLQITQTAGRFFAIGFQRIG